jgi:hypothetical protein
MAVEQELELARKHNDWMALDIPSQPLDDAHVAAWLRAPGSPVAQYYSLHVEHAKQARTPEGLAFDCAWDAWGKVDELQDEIEKLKKERESKDCELDSDRRSRVVLRIKEKEQKYAALVTVAKGLQMNATDAPAQTSTPAPVEDGSDATPDPERRLDLLRALGGTAKYKNGNWTFTGIGALVTREQTDGRKRSTEKTIRTDLKEAAQNERDANRAGFATGLGQR